MSIRISWVKPRVTMTSPQWKYYCARNARMKMEISRATFGRTSLPIPDVHRAEPNEHQDARVTTCARPVAVWIFQAWTPSQRGWVGSTQSVCDSDRGPNGCWRPMPNSYSDGFGRQRRNKRRVSRHRGAVGPAEEVLAAVERWRTTADLGLRGEDLWVVDDWLITDNEYREAYYSWAGGFDTHWVGEFAPAWWRAYSARPRLGEAPSRDPRGVAAVEYICAPDRAGARGSNSRNGRCAGGGA